MSNVTDDFFVEFTELADDDNEFYKWDEFDDDAMTPNFINMFQQKFTTITQPHVSPTQWHMVCNYDNHSKKTKHPKN